MKTLAEIKTERAELIEKRYAAEQAGNDSVAAECTAQLDALLVLEASVRPAKYARRLARHCNDRGVS